MQVSPLAGVAVQSTTGRMLAPYASLDGMPIRPWPGLAIAYAWALGSPAIGYVLLRRRDA